MPFHECATDKKLPRELYWACFVIREGAEDENEDDTDAGATEEKKDGKTAPSAVAPPGKTGKRP